MNDYLGVEGNGMLDSCSGSALEGAWDSAAESTGGVRVSEVSLQTALRRDLQT